MTRLTEKQIAEIRALRIQNISYRNIAITMGISIDTIKSHCHRHGIVPSSHFADNATKKEKTASRKPSSVRQRMIQPEPVCEVTLSYSSGDVDALPFLLETLTSVFSGR
ncbi:MAG: hypothetical protein J6A79_14425 [Clostridia bacterium]|nr:hypothetical protein [Clostridia bacterium]